MKVVLLSEGAKAPQRTNEFAAGYDLYVPKDVIVNPGRNVIPLDIRIELDPNTEGQIRPRSGFSVRGMEGVSLEDLQTPKRFDADILLGTIDEDFRGVVGAIVKSFEDRDFLIRKGTKICQLVVSQYISKPFEIASELSETERGDQGFGHSGTI